MVSHVYLFISQNKIQDNVLTKTTTTKDKNTGMDIISMIVLFRCDFRHDIRLRENADDSFQDYLEAKCIQMIQPPFPLQSATLLASALNERLALAISFCTSQQTFLLLKC